MLSPELKAHLGGNARRRSTIKEQLQLSADMLAVAAAPLSVGFESTNESEIDVEELPVTARPGPLF